MPRDDEPAEGAINQHPKALNNAPFLLSHPEGQNPATTLRRMNAGCDMASPRSFFRKHVVEPVCGEEGS
jgi:hypothetical protein